MIGEGVEQIALAETAATRRRGLTDGGQLRDGVETAATADRYRARAAQLDAVVGRRIVRCRQHCPRHVQVAGGEVEQIGGGEADVDHVDSRRPSPVGERLSQRDAARPHIARHDQCRRR